MSFAGKMLAPLLIHINLHSYKNISLYSCKLYVYRMRLRPKYWYRSKFSKIDVE